MSLMPHGVRKSSTNMESMGLWVMLSLFLFKYESDLPLDRKAFTQTAYIQ